MEGLLVGIVGTYFMVCLILWGMPIAFSLLLVGLAGSLYLTGASATLPQLHLRLYNVVSTYSFTVVPFFILMACFAGETGITSELYTGAEKWVRRVRGGLCIATIVGCAFFAAISGSSVATAALMSRVAFQEMKKHNYDQGFAAGTIAAGGTIGFLIPPSVAFVVYGIITEVSVGKLLVSGVIPGIILTAIFSVSIFIIVKLNPKLAPNVLGPVSRKEKVIALKNVWAVLVTFMVVIGGIYCGLFTPTEAGGVGAFTLFLIALARRRLSLSKILNALDETMGATCMIFLIVYGAMLFGDFLALSGVSTTLISFIGELPISRYLILSMLVLLYFILGCLMESIAMFIITMPQVLPLLLKLGFDPLWFGVIAVLLVQLGLLTPPVGLNVFVVAGITKIPASEIFRGSLIFWVGIIALIALLTAFPEIVLFLPQMMAM